VIFFFQDLLHKHMTVTGALWQHLMALSILTANNAGRQCQESAFITALFPFQIAQATIVLMVSTSRIAKNFIASIITNMQFDIDFPN
jgi:hypothetical protein